MGVRGLTSYIARNAEKYLTPHELHDCSLVIDGDNLACNLFKDVSGSNPAFGGDYDALYRTVVQFFQLLNECNIRAFVLMDGGYESKKLKTLEQRLRSKIGMVKHLNPLQSKPLFPLMMREVFIDAAKDCGVLVMRCIFEADDELAVLARKLNCPVLSYDSDFYIHNVKYIPLITLTLKVHTKSATKKDINRKLRHCEAKNISKREQIKVGESDTKSSKICKEKTIKYLDCCIYTIKNLAGPYLKMEMLTIFAALLGNDYIQRRSFKKFYAQLGFRGKNNTVAKQEKRIKTILRWLRHETKESAIEKILMRVPKEHRELLLHQLEGATSGYACDSSEAFDFFGLDEEDEDLIAEEEEEQEKEDVESSEEQEEEDEVTHCEEEVESEDVSTEDNAEMDENTNDENLQEDDANVSIESDEEIDPTGDDILKTLDQELSSVIPEWLKQRIYNTELPRYFSDLVHLHMYINNPLVENFFFEDCNEIALKILQYIFTLVNQPETPEMRYLTRVVRLTNIHYKRIQPLELTFTYAPYKIDLESFKAIFYDFPDHEKIFEKVTKLPKDYQLYFLVIVYWGRSTSRSTHIHLHSLIICFIALWIIDGKVEPIRDLKKFQKRYGKTANKARKTRDKLISNSESKEKSEDNSKASPLLKDKSQNRIKHIPKSDCILVMENLLKYFHINECFQRRHNDFSSTILHGFSEFQSVFYHLSALNALFNHPFMPVKISQCFNGMFLYNMYTNLRIRPDILYYVQHYIFQESEIMMEFYTFLVEWCTDILLILEKNDTNKPTACKKQLKNKKKVRLGVIVDKINFVDETIDMITPESENSDDSEYNDLNNKFSMLLKVK